MGMGRAQEGGMDHAREGDVAGELPAPLCQPAGCGARQGAADLAGWTVGISEVHGRPTLAMATLAIASTIAS